MRTLLVLALISPLMVACSPEKEQEEQTPYETVADMHGMMTHILEPAADVIWDSAGYIITAEGEENLAPTTEERWQSVMHAAMTVTESGNLLMLPGRSLGDDWNEYSRGLITAGKLAMDATEKQDANALFDAGGRIYQVCLACHNQYWVRIDDTDE